MRERRTSGACELGPIRPPSESTSLLIRVTRNCPWNRCLFCPVYKEKRFEKRSDTEIIAEIDLLAEALERLRDRTAIAKDQCTLSEKMFTAVVHDPATSYEERRIALWMLRGGRHVFLQDADSLIRPAKMVAKVISHIKRRFPSVSRITTYARSRTLAVKTEAALALLRDAGLTRIHVGLESGSDRVLAMVEKGCRADHHIAGIRKAIDAGFEVCCYVMPGLGGRSLSAEHAAETAQVLRAINPRHIRLRTMFLSEEMPLYEKVRSGELTLMEEAETVAEIRTLVRGLKGLGGEVVSDHDHNLLMNINGHLTRDADALEAALNQFLDLPAPTRDAFVVARRTGRLRSLAAFLKDPAVETEMAPLVASLKQAGNGSLLKGMSERFSPRLF